MKHGDFTALAENYALYRPSYAPGVVDTIIALTGKRAADIDMADVGAGTGLWTTLFAERGCRCVAVEPNDAMREEGIKLHKNIEWKKGSAEDTTLESNAFDIVSMASSFHWADFDVALKEFNRALRAQGLFVAVWNPRLIEKNPLLVDIENELKKLVPELNRVSSGRSDFCGNLFDRLEDSDVFKDVLYVEGRHVEQQSPERYIGLWESVNDIRVQAGPERFEKFMNMVKERIAGLETIEAAYTTRAWIARKG